jgi:hypothetical protein
MRRIVSHRQVAYGEVIKTLVRVATTARDGYFEVQAPEGARDFLSSPKLSDQPSSPAASYSVVTADSSTAKKWPGRATDHSPPYSAIEVKNEWSHTSAPPVCLLYTDKDSF